MIFNEPPLGAIILILPMQYLNKPFETCLWSKIRFGVCLFTDCFPVSSRVSVYAVMMNANFDTSRTAGSCTHPCPGRTLSAHR